MYFEGTGYIPDCEDWSTEEAILQLEMQEELVIAEEQAHVERIIQKNKRVQRRKQNKTHKTKERIKNRSYQRTADSYKRNCKKKGYSVKYKGQPRPAHQIVPSNSLGWHRVNLKEMGVSIKGIKLGYIFDVT